MSDYWATCGRALLLVNGVLFMSYSGNFYPFVVKTLGIFLLVCYVDIIHDDTKNKK